MIEAYQIGIRLAVQGNVSAEIGRIGAQFEALNRIVASVNTTMGEMTGKTAGLARAAQSAAAAWRQTAEAMERAARASRSFGGGGPGAGGGYAPPPPPPGGGRTGGGPMPLLLPPPPVRGGTFQGGPIDGRGMIVLPPTGPGRGEDMQTVFGRGAAGLGNEGRPPPGVPSGGVPGGGGPSGGVAGGGALMAAGVLTGHLGKEMFRGLEDLLKSGMGYGDAVSKLRQLGLNPEQLKAFEQTAQRTTTLVPTTTATENLQSLAELRFALGSNEHALTALAAVQQQAAVISAATGGRLGAKDAYDSAKYLEMRGATSDPGRMMAEMTLMTKAIVASGGRLKPLDFLNFSRRAGSQYVSGMSNEFMYTVVPELMQEQGSDRAGTSFASIGQEIVGGVAGRRSIRALQEAGLILPGGIRYGRRGAIEGLNPHAIKDEALMLSNLRDWVKKDLAPTFAGKSHAELISALTRMFGNRTAANQISLYITQDEQIKNRQDLIRAQPADPYKALLQSDNPRSQMVALHAQWENFTAALGSTMTPIIIPALRDASAVLNLLAGAARDFPNTTRAVVSGLAVVSVGLVGVGAAAMAVGSFQVLRGGLVALGAANTAGASANLLGLAGAIGKLAGVAGAAYLGWQGIDLLKNRTDRMTEGPGGGVRNLLHNFMFDPNPMHWTPDYRPEPDHAPFHWPRPPAAPPARRSSNDVPEFQPMGYTRPAPTPQPIIIQVRGEVNGRTLLEFVSRGIANAASGPSSGTTGPDIRVGTFGGMQGASI